jgi:hypothetical protein
VRCSEQWSFRDLGLGDKLQTVGLLSQKRKENSSQSRQVFHGMGLLQESEEEQRNFCCKTVFTQNFYETLVNFTVETSTCSTHGELKIRMKKLSPPIARQKKRRERKNIEMSELHLVDEVILLEDVKQDPSDDRQF